MVNISSNSFSHLTFPKKKYNNIILYECQKKNREKRDTRGRFTINPWPMVAHQFWISEATKNLAVVAVSTYHEF